MTNEIIPANDNVKVTVKRRTRRRARLLAALWEVDILDAIERAIEEALAREGKKKTPGAT